MEWVDAVVEVHLAGGVGRAGDGNDGADGPPLGQQTCSAAPKRKGREERARAEGTHIQWAQTSTCRVRRGVFVSPLLNFLSSSLARACANTQTHNGLNPSNARDGEADDGCGVGGNRSIHRSNRARFRRLGWAGRNLAANRATQTRGGERQMSTRENTCTHTHTNTHSRTQTHTYTRTHVHTYTRTHVHTHALSPSVQLSSSVACFRQSRASHHAKFLAVLLQVQRTLRLAAD